MDLAVPPQLDAALRPSSSATTLRSNARPPVRGKLLAAALVLAVFAIMLLTVYTRVQSLGDPHMLEFDTVYFHGAAERILTEDALQEVESDRYYPLLYDGGDYHVPTYSIVFLCRLNPFCAEAGGQTFQEAIKTAAKWYAPFFTILTIILLVYLGRRAGRDWLIGALLYAIIPGGIFRSVAGFSDKDTAAFFFMILSIYFVYRYIQEKRLAAILIHGIFAGLAMGLASLSLSAYVIYIAPVLIYEAIQLLRFKQSRSFYGTIPFAALPVLMRFWYGNTGGMTFATSTINLAIVGGATFLAAMNFALSLKIPSLAGNKHEREIKMAVAAAAFVLLGFLFLAAAGKSPVGTAQGIYQQIANPLRSSVHGGTVVENQPTSWAWPWQAGFKQGGNSYWNEMGLIFPISLAIAVVAFLSKRDEDLLTACLLAFNIYSATRGVRLLVNLMPVAAIAAGQAISFIFHSRSREHFFIAAGATLLLVAPFVFFGSEGVIVYIALFLAGAALLYGISAKAKPEGIYKAFAVFAAIAIVLQLYPTVFSAASGIHTSISTEWYDNFKWTDLNMRRDSPVLAWWDYGYWIQYFARRPSVADGGNRILKMDQELGLMFTESDEDRAADWMTTLPYPTVTLKLTGDGDSPNYTYSNEVFAPEFYSSFIPEEKLVLNATCTSPLLPKTCASFSIGNFSAVPEGARRSPRGIELAVSYRGAAKRITGDFDPATGALSGLSGIDDHANFEQDMASQGDLTEWAPYLESDGSGGLLFGYRGFSLSIPVPRLMTHDATMVGKMAASSSIANRPVQYLQFSFAQITDTPLGAARLYTNGPYFIAAVDANGTVLPLIGVAGTGQVRAISEIVDYSGITKVNTTMPTEPSAVILSSGQAIYMTPGASTNLFTKTFIFDAVSTARFREVFNNGFAKSFYVI